MLVCPEIDSEPYDQKKLLIADDLKAWKGIVRRVETFERKVCIMEEKDPVAEVDAGNYETNTF